MQTHDQQLNRTQLESARNWLAIVSERLAVTDAPADQQQTAAAALANVERLQQMVEHERT